MSSTTVKAIYPGIKTENLNEFRNAHGSAPVIWNEVAKRYLGLKDFEYSLHSDKLWPLYKRADMPSYHRSVLLMTYDNALVMKQNYKQAAFDIRAFLSDFPAMAYRDNHWPDIADVFGNDPDCPAIGFHMTSVAKDPFQGPYNEANDCYEQPDWRVYWDVYIVAAEIELKKDAI